MARSERCSRELIRLAVSLGYSVRPSPKRAKTVQLRHATTGALVTLPLYVATVGRNYPNHEALLRREARGGT